MNERRYLNADDLEFAHDWLMAAQLRGLSNGPSETLRNLYEDISTRAMDTSESGYGSQLVGTQYVGQLWEAARERSVVFAQINSFEMAQPTAQLPVEAAPPEMFYVSEATSASASDYSTSKTGSQDAAVTAK